MKRRLLVSSLVTALGVLSGSVAAQEVGNVLSSTPVLKRVTEPRSTCTNDASGQQQCRTTMVTEDRQIGYKVVYEYAGRQHTVQLPFPPGATIPLDVQVSVQGANPTPAMPSYSAEPEVVQRVVRNQVYVESPYYEGPYYAGYYSPWYPFVGAALGYGLGYYYGGYGYGYGYRGWYGHRGGGHGHGGGGGGGHAGGGHRGR